MSVALVAHECNLLAAFAAEQKISAGSAPTRRRSARGLASLLWLGNIQAFVDRYGWKYHADIKENAIAYRKPGFKVSEQPRLVYTACETWEYQCDGLPGFDCLESARLVAAIKRRCITLDPSLIDESE